MSPAAGAVGGVEEQERADRQRGRRPEWHNDVTSASRGGSTAQGWASRWLADTLRVV